MKNLKYNIVLITLSAILAVACSKQSRTNAWDPSAAEISDSVQTFLSEAQTANTAGADSVQGIAQFLESSGQSGSIYYAESGKTGLASSVASILDFTIFGLPSSSYINLATAKVLLLDQYTESGREFTLAMVVQYIQGDGSASEKQSVAFKTTEAAFTDTKATLTFDNFILTTFDLSDDVQEDFAGIIQFQVTDKNGVSFGQFSSLIGFGG